MPMAVIFRRYNIHASEYVYSMRTDPIKFPMVWRNCFAVWWDILVVLRRIWRGKWEQVERTLKFR